MAATNTIDVNSREILQSIELRVTGLRRYAFRCAVAAALIRLAAWVAGVSIVIEPTAEPRAGGLTNPGEGGPELIGPPARRIVRPPEAGGGSKV